MLIKTRKTKKGVIYRTRKTNPGGLEWDHSFRSKHLCRWVCSLYFRALYPRMFDEYGWVMDPSELVKVIEPQRARSGKIGAVDTTKFGGRISHVMFNVTDEVFREHCKTPWFTSENHGGKPVTPILEVTGIKAKLLWVDLPFIR